MFQPLRQQQRSAISSYVCGDRLANVGDAADRVSKHCPPPASACYIQPTQPLVEVYIHTLVAACLMLLDKGTSIPRVAVLITRCLTGRAHPLIRLVHAVHARPRLIVCCATPSTKERQPAGDKQVRLMANLPADTLSSQARKPAPKRKRGGGRKAAEQAADHQWRLFNVGVPWRQDPGKVCIDYHCHLPSPHLAG